MGVGGNSLASGAGGAGRRTSTVTCSGLDTGAGVGVGVGAGAGVDETEGVDSAADDVLEATARMRTLALGANLFFDLSGEEFG